MLTAQTGNSRNSPLWSERKRQKWICSPIWTISMSGLENGQKSPPVGNLMENKDMNRYQYAFLYAIVSLLLMALASVVVMCKDVFY